MEIVCLDFEGVLVPEIWIGVAEKTGIEKLKLTTRDVPDYDELMKYRLKILEEYNEAKNTYNTLLDDLTKYKKQYPIVLLTETLKSSRNKFLEVNESLRDKTNELSLSKIELKAVGIAHPSNTLLLLSSFLDSL